MADQNEQQNEQAEQQDRPRVPSGDELRQWNASLVEQFRASGGVGKAGPVDFENLVLITTTGRRSGEPRTTPLGYATADDGSLILFASGNGSPSEPMWCRNLRADPRVTVEVTGRSWETDAEILSGDARTAAYDRWVEQLPHTADHQDRAGREIPMIRVPLGG